VKLLADAMLGSLARICRMCGHDTAYCLDRGVEADDDDDVLALAVREDRTLLTRDRQLAARAPDSLLLEATAVDDQLAELAAAAGVDLSLSGGERCGDCNGELRELREGETRAQYVPGDADPVWACRDCGRQFYRGSHWTDVESRLP
jgi:uncharacterized protein with PIN domain